MDKALCYAEGHGSGIPAEVFRRKNLNFFGLEILAGRHP